MRIQVEFIFSNALINKSILLLLKRDFVIFLKIIYFMFVIFH